MNEKTFAALEYEQLKKLVRRYAQTPMGAKRVAALAPFGDLPALQNALAALSECAALQERGIGFSFSGIEDPTDALALLSIKNTTLDPLQMLDLAALIEQALSARAIIRAEKEAAPTLFALAENVSPDLIRVGKKIKEKILPGGILDDRASPELARLRQEINRQRARISKQLESILKNLDVSAQDEFVTIRNDRYVIPVKADHRGKVGGVTHGLSSSGNTMFIEPLSAIEANNELQTLRDRELQETAKVLFELTEGLRNEITHIETAAIEVAKLDLVNAKSVFLRTFKCVTPVISTDNVLFLKEARHPLLEENLRPLGGEVVPLSLELNPEKPVMIISGANAGGKTVALKTVGLLSLMAISGMPVPADDAKVPFYKTVLADIGDQQSLAANLSTFTSHISNIADMMRVCREPALILLDEIGTGTDPEEGSALGVAVVDHFHRKFGAQVMASTHYRGLKMYAENNAHVQNASVEFNEKTLQPTYRLLTGLAGVSAGLDIAKRFGIPDNVIDSARAGVDRASLDANEYLQKLRRESAEAADIRVALEVEREAVAAKYSALEKDFEKRERERRRQFEAELAKTVDEFERQSRGFLSGIEDKALRTRLEKEAQARKTELKRQIGEAFGSGGGAGAAAPIRQDVKTVARAAAVGDRVLLKSLRQIGTVEKIDGDTAQVLAGSMRLREKLKNLETLAAGESAAPAKQSRAEKLQAKARREGSTPDFGEQNRNAELNLIGRTTMEAAHEVDKFLDAAYVAGFPHVRIIHGMGTGALRSAIHSFLQGHPHVARFMLARQEEGGSGATIVELK